MVACSVLNCDVTRRNNPDQYTFHRFPRNQALREKWMRAVNRPDWTPSSNSTICSKHFDSKCFIQREHRRVLMKDTIPTLFVHIIDDVTIKPDPDAIEREENMVQEETYSDGRIDSEDTEKCRSSMIEGNQNFNDIAPILREMSSTLQVMAYKQEDTFESFGKYVANTLRNMPEQSSREKQLQIMSLLVADPNKINPSTSAEGKS